MEAFVMVSFFLVPFLFIMVLGLAFIYAVFKEAHIIH
jgi:hypothetical protein